MLAMDGAWDGVLGRFWEGFVVGPLFWWNAVFCGFVSIVVLDMALSGLCTVYIGKYGTLL